MSLNHFFRDPDRVIQPHNHRGDPLQLRHLHLSGATAALTSIFTAPECPIQTSDSIPPVPSSTAGDSIAQELGAPRKLYAHTVPSRARGCSLGAYARASPRPPQSVSVGSPVGVQAQAQTNSYKEAVPARDGLRLSVKALQQRAQLVQCGTGPGGNGCTSVAAPFPSSVLPPWAWLDFTAFASPGSSVNGIAVAGDGGSGAVSRDVNLTENRIATPVIQAGRARNGVSSPHEERQKQVLSEPQTSSLPVTTTAGEVSTVAVVSSFSCSPLFDWVPYDGWDDSDLCQLPGGCYHLRGFSDCQCSAHGRLRHGDLSGILGSTESNTSTAAQAQTPGSAGGAAVLVTGEVGQAAVLSQRSKDVGHDCSNVPPAGQQTWREREAPVLTTSLEALALQNALERDMVCGVYCNTHQKGERGGGNVGGPDAAGGQRDVNTPPRTPSTLTLPTDAARGSASLSQLRSEGVAVGSFPFSAVISDTRAVEAEGAGRSSAKASGCVSASLATASRGVGPLSRGCSSSASQMHTNLRTVQLQSSATVRDGLDCTPSTAERMWEASAVPTMYMSIIAEDTGSASVVQSSVVPNRGGDFSYRVSSTASDSAGTGKAGATLPSVRTRQERAAFGNIADNEVCLNDPNTDLTLGLPAQTPSASLTPRLPGDDRPLCAAAGDADRVSTAAKNAMTCEYNSSQPWPRGSDHSMSAKSAMSMSMIDLLEPRRESTLPSGDVGGQGNHIWSAVRAPLTERNVGNSASAPVSRAAAAVADATSRRTVPSGALDSESGEQMVAATYAMGATHAAVPAAESTVLATHPTGTGRGEVPPLSASSPVVPTFVVVKLKDWRSEDPIMPDFPGLQVADGDGSRLDCSRSRRPTTSLLPEWCHAIANTLLAPSPVLPKSNLLGPQFLVATPGTSITPTAGTATVTSEVVSRFGSVRTRWRRSSGSAANLGSAVDGLGDLPQTGLKGSSPVFLTRGLLSLPSSTTYIDGSESVSGSRGVVRIVSKEGVVEFDAYDAPPMYNRVRAGVDSTHTTTTSATATAPVMASGGGAPAAAVIRRRRCTPSFHCSTLSHLCQDHQEQPEGSAENGFGPTASARGLSCIASIPASTLTSLASPMSNLDGVCTLSYGHDYLADDSAWIVPCSGIGVTRGRQGGVVGTATGVVDTAGLLPHSDLIRLNTIHTHRPPTPMMCCTPEMLAADNAMQVALENASARASQRRDLQTCTTSDPTAVGLGFLSRDSFYITDESPNARHQRGDDVTTTWRRAGVTNSLGRRVGPSAAPRTNAIAGSPAGSVAPVGAVREGGRDKGGGHVVHISEDLVNTTHSIHHRLPGDLTSSFFHSENIPNVHPAPSSKEGAPTPLFPLASQLQYHLPQQRQHASSRAVLTQSVSRMPTKPPAQDPKSGRPPKHTARCDG